MKYKSLIVFIILLFSVQIADATTYLQVQNSTTIQANNDTEYSTASTTYVLQSIIVPLQNISGIVNISFDHKCSANSANGCYAQVKKNGVIIGTQHIHDSNSYEQQVENISITLNTTDTLELWGKRGMVLTNYVKNFRLNYDYVVPTITSPINNSASTSRIQNITWSGTSLFQYQVSTQSNFATLIHNNTTTNAYSGNITLPVGLNYIRVRGYNSGINETNWTTNQFMVYDSPYNIGGSGYNWSANASFSNQWVQFLLGESDYSHFWRLEEGTGTNLKDENTSANWNMTLVGSPIWTTDTWGTALRFDGGDDWGTFTITNFSNVSTFIGDFNTTDNVNGQRIFDTSSTILLYLTASDNLQFYVYNATNVAESWTTPTNSVLQNMSYNYSIRLNMTSNQTPIFTLNGTQVTLTRVGSTNIATGFYNLPGTGYLGNRAAGSRQFKGTMGRLGIYNRNLTDAEIALFLNHQKANGTYTYIQNNNIPFLGYIYNSSVDAIGSQLNPLTNILYPGTNQNNISLIFNISNNSILTNATVYSGNLTDTTTPNYSSLASTWHHVNGTSITHSSYWSDTSNLSGYTFSFDNGTGTFVNDSYVYLNPQVSSSWINISKTINSTIGTTIRWKVYVNDVYNNWNETDIQSYTTQQYYVYDLLNGAYIFSDNGTGAVTSNTLSFLVGASVLTTGYTSFTSNTNKTITNISRGTLNYDTLNFTLNGSDGYLNWSSYMYNGAQNFTYSIDGANQTTDLANSDNLITFNYTGTMNNVSVSTWYSEPRIEVLVDNSSTILSTYSPFIFKETGVCAILLGRNELWNGSYSDRLYRMNNTLVNCSGSWGEPNVIMDSVISGESALVHEPVMIKNDTTGYTIYYVGTDDSGGQNNTVRVAKSPNGNGTFTNYGAVNISGLPPDMINQSMPYHYGMASPTIIEDDGILRLYWFSDYYWNNLSESGSIFTAIGSPDDGINFTYVGVVDSNLYGESNWDSKNHQSGKIHKSNNKYILTYSINAIHIAYSVSSLNPLDFSSDSPHRFFNVGRNGTFDDYLIGGGSIDIENSIMYYAGSRYFNGTTDWFDNSSIAKVNVHINFIAPPPPELDSYSPATPLTSTGGNSQIFTASFLNAVQNITWYINGTQVQQNLSVASANYTNLSAEVGIWNLTAIASNTEGTAQHTWIWTVSNSVSVYDTGWQYIMVNDSQTMSDYGTLTGAVWLANWNSTSQAFESHKAGWSYRTSTGLNKGSGVMARFSTNKTIEMTMNTSYNWTVATNYTLLGNEQVRTLGELNTSLNSLGTCQVTNITYVNPITQVESVYTCGSVGNESIEVPYGAGFWTFASESFDRVRT